MQGSQGLGEEAEPAAGGPVLAEPVGGLASVGSGTAMGILATAHGAMRGRA